MPIGKTKVFRALYLYTMPAASDPASLDDVCTEALLGYDVRFIVDQKGVSLLRVA